MLIKNKAKVRTRKVKKCALWRDNYRNNTNCEEVGVVNINQKVEKWVSSEIMTKNELPIIHKTPFPFYFHGRKRCS